MDLFVGIFIKYWFLWAHLFDGVPYGNPYGAMAIAALVLVAIGWVIKAIADDTCN